MIPSIRVLIDQANNAAEQEGGDNNGHRVSIRPEEIVKLCEFRREDHTRRAREIRNSRLLEMTEAESRYRAELVSEGDGFDEQRPFGLLRGMAVFDVWENVFRHVYDAEDIANLRDSCPIFRDLLEMKYKIIRLNEVMLKLGHRLGGMKTLLTLRGVCKLTKAAIHDWIKEDRVHYNWNLEANGIGGHPSQNNWISKPQLSLPRIRFFNFYPFVKDDLNHLQLIISTLELLPRDTFFIRTVRVIDSTQGKSRNDVLTFRNLFEQLLQLIGGSIRCFEYRPEDVDTLGNYNRLRSWVLFMPNLEELTIRVVGEPVDYVNPPVLPHTLPPFPTCPSLKRFSNSWIGMRAPFVEQIFLGNPWISGVQLQLGDIYDDAGINAEIDTYRRALGTLQLERFNSEGDPQIPRQQLLGFRFEWPLRYLVLTIPGNGGERFSQGMPSRDVFSFINSFRQTLEEVTVTWKLRDTGGFLDLPKAKKVLWRLFTGFTSLEFMIPLESLERLDIDMEPLRDVNPKPFIYNMNLPRMFPQLKEIRSRNELIGIWFQVWKR